MTQTTLDDLVRTSVREAMSRMLGSAIWKAISFYFDVRLVSRERRSFEDVLDKLFGPPQRSYSK